MCNEGKQHSNQEPGSQTLISSCTLKPHILGKYPSLIKCFRGLTPVN